MAGTSRPQVADVSAFSFDPRYEEIARLLRAAPYCFRYFQAVHLLEDMQPGTGPAGEANGPADEPVRFGATASLSFPASEIQQIDFTRRPPRMYVNFFGLQGIAGVLPLVYTEELQRKGSTPLNEFLDIINHRFLSFYYRAWKRYKLAVSPYAFRDRVLALVGLGTPGLAGRTSVEDETWVFYSGLLSMQPRSAVGLEQLLQDFFDVPVEVQQFAGSWRSLDEEYQCQLERNSESESLRLGVVIGNVVWDRQSRVRLRIGPLSYDRYCGFLPGERDHKRLRDITRFYSRDEVDFEVQLVLARREVKGFSTGPKTPFRLGWTTWISTKERFPRDADDTVLEPSVADEFLLQ